jgi:hypothetical protein
MEAGLPAAGLVDDIAWLEAGGVTAGRLTGVRSEAGRALTPWRYASAMAVTMLT